MKFLLIEDNEEMRRMLRTLIEDMADQIHECSDGAEAIAAYGRYLPDWVLIDIRLKEKDGIAVAAEIKALFPKARILIVTDYDDEELREQALRAGACACVLKENLLEMREVLFNRRPRSMKRDAS
ncbi:MAG: response regulator [Acidobacteriota bacterium]